MSRAREWTEVEDRMIVAAHNQNVSNTSIAKMLAREGYGLRTPNAVRKHYWKLMREDAADLTADEIDTDQAISESVRLKRSDAKFQQRMMAEGFLPGISRSPGTDWPRFVSLSIGSCTSSAGWAT